MNELIYRDVKQLRQHPGNMRQQYLPEQVQTMADSIQANHGVIHALQIVEAKEEGVYWVVDGNLRLRAAQSLRPCPPLKCELVDDEQAAQLLRMVTDKVRFDPDPISEALHYQRLGTEGLGPREIADRTGKSRATIDNRLQLLTLDPPLQALVAAGTLHADPRVARALMAIPDADVRVKLGTRLAGQGLTIKAIVEACGKLAERLAQKSKESSHTPMLAVGSRRAGHPVPVGKSVPPTHGQVRAAAAAMCEACDIKQTVLANVPEPAWSLISHHADEVCGGCSVRTLAGACNDCPGVEFIARLLKAEVVKA